MFKTLTRLFRRQPAPGPIVLTIVPADNQRVSIDDRKKLRAWLEDPVTKLALGIAESQMPRIMSAGISGSVEQRRYESERRLSQLQGWYTFRNTLLQVGHTPAEIQRMVEETYPSEPEPN